MLKHLSRFFRPRNPLGEANDHDLTILDDFFPGMLSAFRVAEYNHYLSRMEKVQICSTATHFNKYLRHYAKAYPENVGAIKKFTPKNSDRTKLFYLNFLNNAYQFIEHVENMQVPFVFTLYPGGGFQLNGGESDKKLRRVLGSQCFRHVITTQRVTKEYLIAGDYCDDKRIELVNGLVVPETLMDCGEKVRFQEGKNTFDICFVAHKYMAGGVDKGFDTFAKLAEKLVGSHDSVRFHVVGNFDRKDADFAKVGNDICFYGPRHTDFFPGFYAKMDIILSPNVPFVLAPGAFDGFPTGCCVEAGLCGVAVFCNDKLQQNSSFVDREEIVILPSGIDAICDVIGYYRRNTDELYTLAAKGQRRFRELYNIEAQMTPRINVLKRYL